jgi:hypothetical protein
MTTLLKKKLHEFAILRGWYKDVTYGCPLNIIRTVFGTYAFEGIYIMRSLGSLISEIREWEYMESAAHTGKLLEDIHARQCELERVTASLNIYRARMAPQIGEWKEKKDKSGYYRRIKHPCSLPMFSTESVKTLPE